MGYAVLVEIREPLDETPAELVTTRIAVGVQDAFVASRPLRLNEPLFDD